MGLEIIKPTKSLPENYHQNNTLDLSKDWRLAIILSILVTIVLLVSGGVFVWLAAILRHENEFGIVFNLSVWGIVLVGVSATIFVVIVHEGIHGICFWRFTGEKPKFGFKGVYAYAAAPAWYLPRRQYLVVGLAPLAGITLAGMLLLPVVPQTILPFLLVVMVFNFAGSMGDAVIVGWLLGKPRTVYINDYGDGVTTYTCDEEKER